MQTVCLCLCVSSCTTVFVCVHWGWRSFQVDRLQVCLFLCKQKGILAVNLVQPRLPSWAGYYLKMSGESKFDSLTVCNVCAVHYKIFMFNWGHILVRGILCHWESSKILILTNKISVLNILHLTNQELMKWNVLLIDRMCKIQYKPSFSLHKLYTL